MPRYSEERRQAVVAKLLPPHNLTPHEVAEQEGISVATVYKWRKEARAEGRCLPDALGKGADGWSSRDKFTAVVESAAMNAEEIAEYGRRRGLYPEQLERWRHDCEQAASLSHTERQREADEARQQRKRIKQLEKELARKNEALAETAALLALRKKARAIWGARTNDQRPGSPTCCRADRRSPRQRRSSRACLSCAGAHRPYVSTLDA